MMTIQKPKRVWQKKKDYNKKFLIRKAQRRNKVSFDDGSDDQLTMQKLFPIQRIVDDGVHGAYVEDNSKDPVLVNGNNTVTVQPNVFVNNSTGAYSLELDGQSFPLEVYDKAGTDDRALWTYKLPNGQLVTPHKYGKLLTVTPTMEKSLSPVDPVMEMYLSTALGKPLFDLMGRGVQMVGAKAVDDFLSRYGSTKVGNWMRGRMLSNALNKSVSSWDGTVGLEYFNSPYNWYRWTETPEILSIRRFGKNVTTHDDSVITGTPNSWRSKAMDLYKGSKEGYWYKADKLPEDASFKDMKLYINGPNKSIGFGRRYGAAHGNRTQASYGQPWNSSISASGIGHLGLLEGLGGGIINRGISRTDFKPTPSEDIPLGDRIGFKTGEMPMDNLSWFERLPNGRFSYEGPVLPDKRVDLTPKFDFKKVFHQPRMQFDKPTYQMYTGKQYKISDIINKDGSVNIDKIKEVYREALKRIPKGYTPQHRLENTKWHKTDWNTFLHSRDAYKRALQFGYPDDALFPTLMHDAGKLWTGDGHGPYGASIIKLMFPDATEDQIMAIYGHMTQEPYGMLGNLVKGADIHIPNKWRDAGLEESSKMHNSGKDIHIKKANRGKFTEAANEHNMGVLEFANKVLSAPKGKYSPTLRKRANFARNFAH